MRQVMEARFATVEWIIGVPGIGDGRETRLKRVVEQESADQALADAEQLLYHLDRLEAADDACDPAENPGLRAWRHRAFRWRLGEQATMGRARIAVRAGLICPEGGEMAVEGTDSSKHERPLGEIAGVVDEVARGEIVRSVGHNVVGADDIDGILRHEPRGVKARLDMW